MSRGPGRAQRAIIRAFEANPSAVFSAKQIVELAFPGIAHEAKHRVAALRAARTLADSSPRFDTHQGSPGIGGMIICNAADRRSLGIAKVFEKFAGTKPLGECVAILDDPDGEAYPEWQIGGFFDLLAKRNALWAEWRDEEAEILSARISERIEQARRDRSASSSTSSQEDAA